MAAQTAARKKLIEVSIPRRPFHQKSLNGTPLGVCSGLVPRGKDNYAYL